MVLWNHLVCLKNYTLSVILRFKGSPPILSNWTKPKSMALHGNSKMIHMVLANILITKSFSSTSSEAIFELVSFIFQKQMKLLLNVIMYPLHIQGVQRKWLQIQYSSCNHFLCTPCTYFINMFISNWVLSKKTVEINYLHRKDNWIYSHGQDLVYKFVSNFTNKLILVHGCTLKGLCFENIKTALRLIRILKNKNIFVFVRFHKSEH